MKLRAASWLQVLGSWLAVGAAVHGAELPVLTRWATGEEVSWEEYRGTILVVDFFAPWCLPCVGVSRDLHEGVARYYGERGGNAQGVPVRVLAVNIDTSNPGATARFMGRAGLDTALQDVGGRLFAAWGGRGVPFIVVIDATDPGSAAPGRMVERFEAPPGVERLRRCVDRLGTRATAERPAGGSWSRFWGTHGSGVVEASGEGLISSDYRLYQTGVLWEEKRSWWDLRLQASANLYDLVYEPAPSDLISQEQDLWAEQFSFQGRVRVRWADDWQAELQGGVYDGFADYRSLWLDEYYRQYFGAVRGYEATDPGGWSLSPGVRWESVPGVAWLQAGLVIQQDEVSPGYEKAPFQPLVRGTSHLDTLAGVVGLENVVSRRVRAQQTLRITDTTDRDLRYEYSLSIFWAAADRWVVRSAGGTTLEPPDFHAYYGQLGLERDWGDRWFCGVFGRYYTDDGLVRDPKIVSSASPPLQTWQAGVTLRHQAERWSAKLSAGPYLTRYEEVPLISRHFSTLYADRDWLQVQAAFALRF